MVRQNANVFCCCFMIRKIVFIGITYILNIVNNNLDKTICRYKYIL